MASVPLRNASDTYVSEKAPARRFGSATRLYLADGSSANTRFAYIYFGVPSGMSRTTVLSAKLRVYSGSRGFAGSVTASLQRVSERFSINRANWNNKPAVTGAIKQVTKSNAANGALWEFDVTDIMQQVADGAPWYGFRLSATGGNAKWFHSSQSTASDFRPVLEIEWTAAPETPEKLIPDNGLAVSIAKPTLRWDFVDRAGDTTMQSANLRLFSTEALALANGPGDLLDTSLAINTPQIDLDATAYGGLAEGGTLWWRVQNVDGSGLLSGWSDPASFTRTSKGALAITNPAAAVAPNPAFVSEPTPPFSWTFTGRTQQAYEVFLSTPETPEKRLWQSGVVTSTETAVTPPSGVLTEVGKTYRVTVRIYDTVNRVAVPDDPTFVEATRDFVFQLDNTVATVSSFTGTLDPRQAKVTLEWTDATMPDAYVVLRDGKAVAEVEPVDLLVSGTSYRYVDTDARPRREHTWSVARKVNGKTSQGNPTFVGTPKAITTTLSTQDNSRVLYLFNPDVAADRAEESTVHYLLGNAPPVLVTQSQRGYEGQISGVLLNDTIPSLNAEQQLAHLEWMKDNPGTVLKLVWVDKVMQVVILNVTDSPIPNPDGSVEYLVSFDFFEVGF